MNQSTLYRYKGFTAFTSQLVHQGIMIQPNQLVHQGIMLRPNAPPFTAPQNFLVNSPWPSKPKCLQQTESPRSHTTCWHLVPNNSPLATKAVCKRRQEGHAFSAEASGDSAPFL
eukprot:893965-Pelagomonas_calceolata.AAC.5